MTTKQQQKFEKKVLDQFMSEKSLVGKDGPFAPMLKNIREKTLFAEMDSHLDNDESAKDNKHIGKGNKKLKSGFGSFDIETPKDHQSSFEPEPVKISKKTLI